MEVKRYFWEERQMQEHKAGMWVRHDDYLTLQAERDALRERVSKFESPKLDLSKRKTVQPKDVLGMVRLGIKPVLVCNKSIEDMGIDSPWELGMYARVKSISASLMGDDGFEIVLDLAEFSDINDGMAGSYWHMKGGNGMGTCKQAGWWNPEDTLWVPIDSFDLEMVEAPL